MSRELNELLDLLRSADLKMAAFELVTELSGGAYPKEMQQALQLYLPMHLIDHEICLLKSIVLDNLQLK